jgi:hypothetical protein
MLGFAHKAWPLDIKYHHRLIYQMDVTLLVPENFDCIFSVTELEAYTV